MQKNMIWKGLDADTTENCAINFLNDGIVVRSEIMGWNEGSAINLEYMIKLDNRWEVREFEVAAVINGRQFRVQMMRNGDSEWSDSSGSIYHEFAGCRYIDITLTPFTNTLPINGLVLEKGDRKGTDVLYIDIMENDIRRDRQHYTKLDRLRYRFENEGGSFRADIDVDEQGFVTDYPQLFQSV